MTDLQYQRGPGMTAIQEEHAAIARLLPAGRSVAYLDYAMTTNVGDQLIVLGTLAFFEKYGIRRRFSRNLGNSEPVGKLPLEADDIIVLHGGGNFGDIYPHFQRYREEVIAHHRDRRIVIMPQTVHFSTPDALARAAERMNTHPDLTLFVRDNVSLNLTRPYFGERVHLMPDMAHQLWPGLLTAATAKPAPARGPLMLMRRDVEKGGIPTAIAALSDQFSDWDDILSPVFRARRRTVNPMSRLGVDMDEFYFASLRQEVGRIARRLGGSTPWITSRLHGVIMGLLLDKPVFAVDNSYGKISSYLHAWRRYLDPVHLLLADGPAERAVAYIQATRGQSGADAWTAYKELPRP